MSVTINLARRCAQRMTSCKLKGNKRNVASLEFLMGAAIAIEECGDSETAQKIAGLAMLGIGSKGYSALEQYIATADAAKEHAEEMAKTAETVAKL